MNKRTISIAPSILSADFKHLGEDIASILYPFVDYLHFDVMDGHFVKNISFGVPVLKSLGHTFPLVNDVHLMIDDPEKYFDSFISAGADSITFHLEACRDDQEIKEHIDYLHKKNIKAGISIRPSTAIEEVYPYLDLVDLILVMAVEPGFGGQSFLNESISRIMALRNQIDHRKLKTLIEVDGGINDVVAQTVIEAGADILVSGSYIFSSNDKKLAIEKLLGIKNG
jgi:ribulose-phosphate 3-epimerase